jgi:hypothetical protein
MGQYHQARRVIIIIIIIINQVVTSQFLERNCEITTCLWPEDRPKCVVVNKAERRLFVQVVILGTYECCVVIWQQQYGDINFKIYASSDDLKLVNSGFERM